MLYCDKDNTNLAFKRQKRKKKMGFTHYMIFGEPKQSMSPEEAKKAWGKFAEALKEYNLKMKGPWGPLGVPEGGCFLLKGSYGDFEKYVGSDAWQKCPIGKTRTITLYDPIG